MDHRPLRVTVVDGSLDARVGPWGDGSGGWQPPAAEWVGRLAALGVPFDVRTEVRGPVPGLLVVPDPATTEVTAADAVTGPPPATAEETLLVLAAALGAVVVPDQRGVLVLRLDDPGAAVKAHLRSWRHPPVTPEAWQACWEAVRPLGRMSVFCCPGYVRDDGTVVDSRAELPQEWAALDEAVGWGLADLECHGFTHLHPDLAAWTAAPDRYDDPAWYRELWPPDLPTEPSVAAQGARLGRWQQATGSAGTAVVAPGEAWGANTLAAARERGFALFNSWGVCFLGHQAPVWAVGIGSPYLDRADPDWFADCLPQVGYWHDRDLAVHGPRWVGEQLDAWRDCGARRAWAFADLARAHRPIDAALVGAEVVVRSAPDVPLRVVRR